MSKVEHIICYRKKGEPGQEVEEANLLNDCGMEFDYHATGGERQITIMSNELKEWMHTQKIKGFCFEKFAENIVISDIDLEELPTDTILEIGEVKLKLSSFRKKCYAQFCEVEKNKQPCMLFHQSRFARVVAGGVLVKGTMVEIK